VPKETHQEQVLRDRLAAIAGDEGGPLSDGIPVRWLEDPTWRCANQHVSKRFQPARRDHRICVFKYCGQPVYPTFPEDRSGPLTDRRVSVPPEVPATETETLEDGGLGPR